MSENQNTFSKVCYNLHNINVVVIIVFIITFAIKLAIFCVGFLRRKGNKFSSIQKELLD